MKSACQKGKDYDGAEDQDADGGPNQIRSMRPLRFASLKIVQQSAPAAIIAVLEFDHRHACTPLIHSVFRSGRLRSKLYRMEWRAIAAA